MKTQGMKKGDKVSVIVYSGHSKEEADAVFNYLNDHYECLPPAPMEGSKLKLKVTSVERRTIPSDEIMTVNEKFKSTYANSFKCFLIMGINKPVKIADAKSGLIRRLIDVSPSGEKLSMKE